MNDVCRDQLIVRLRLYSSKYEIFFDVENECFKLNGPAVIYDDGAKEWLVNDVFCNSNGPAVMYYNGRKEWLINNKLIRKILYE